MKQQQHCGMFIFQMMTVNSIIMELADDGDLSQKIVAGVLFQENDVWRVLIQVRFIFNKD